MALQLPIYSPRNITLAPFYSFTFFTEILSRPFLWILLPSGAFRPSKVCSFDLPFPLHHMSFGSQSVGDPVVPKFDMHIYTSVLTADEVNSLVKEYAIPLDLRPCVPPYTLTMNKLLKDKISIYEQYLELSGVRVPFFTLLIDVIKHFRLHISQLVSLGLNRLTMFEIYYGSLNINPTANLFCAFYKLNKQGHWFSFERRLGKGGHDKNFNEFFTSLKHWKDRFFLIDCRAILDAMSWRHQNSSVADPPPTGVLIEDIRRLFATSMSQFLKFSMSRGVRVVKGTALMANEAIVQHTTPPLPFGSQILEKSDHQKVVEHEDERVLAAKRKSQEAKDKAAGKRSGTHHSASPLTTVILNDYNPTAGGRNLDLESTNRTEGDTGNSLHNVKNDTEDTHAHSGEDELYHDERDEQARRHATGSTGRVVSSSFGGSGRQVFPQRNPGGDGIGSSLRANVSPHALFVLAWNLTTHSILNDAKSCRDMMINLATQRYQALNDDYGELYQSHRSCQDVSDRLTDTQNQLVDAIHSRSVLSDDHKILQQEHLGCVGKEAALTKKLVVVEKEKDELLDKNREQAEQIRRLEKSLASKTAFLSESESTASALKGNLEHLTVDLSQAQIVRHSYVRQLLPTGMKVERSKEDAESILATVADFDPGCKSTFMSAFDALFNYYSSLGHWHLDSSGASCVPRNIRHLTIGTWTHPECLAFQELLFVTWPLALGLIQSVLRFGKYASLNHWHLDSFGGSCVSGNIRHLAIGTWTHPERLASRELLFVTWPLTLGLIRVVLPPRNYYSSLGHWHLDSSGVGNTIGIKIG
ncbi:hypothetical protein Tco_0987243 [Tanacetum coccineum]